MVIEARKRHLIPQKFTSILAANPSLWDEITEACCHGTFSDALDDYLDATEGSCALGELNPVRAERVAHRRSGCGTGISGDPLAMEWFARDERNCSGKCVLDFVQAPAHSHWRSQMWGCSSFRLVPQPQTPATFGPRIFE